MCVYASTGDRCEQGSMNNANDWPNIVKETTKKMLTLAGRVWLEKGSLSRMVQADDILR